MENDHIPNEILPNLFLGSSICRHDPSVLMNLNIKHVVDLSRQRNLPEDPAMHYEMVDVMDRDTNIERHFQLTHSIIHQALEAGEGVLVHCSYGISRSATVVLSYLVAFASGGGQRMTLHDAWKLVKGKRRVIQPNVSFLKQLITWETQHHGKTTLKIGTYGQMLWQDEAGEVNTEETEFPCGKLQVSSAFSKQDSGGKTNGQDNKRSVGWMHVTRVSAAMVLALAISLALCFVA